MENNEEDHIYKNNQEVNEANRGRFIVMELLGNNLAKLKKSMPEGRFTRSLATRLLMQMLEAIEQVHNKGFIHRDIKASNFMIGKDMKTVYIADFGLAKAHTDKQGKVLPPRKRADFRGTISFASLNAHLEKELSRRDDLWSWFF